MVFQKNLLLLIESLLKNKVQSVHDLQEQLAYFLGYKEILIWNSTSEGKLYNPYVKNISEEALQEYLRNYYKYDALYIENNKEMFIQNRVLRLQDVPEVSEDYKSFLREFQIVDQMVVALSEGERFIGAIGLTYHKNSRFFTRKDVEIFKYLSVVISYVISSIKKNDYSDLLTPREREIAELAKEGLTNQEIGEKLYISINTVKKHLQSIYSKFEISNRASIHRYIN